MTSPVSPSQLALLESLARTPFLRAPDLALDVGLSLPQTYVHLRALAQRRLLESLSRPGNPRGSCRLYSLTPLGFQALAQDPSRLGPPEVYAAGTQDQRLLALLPRLDRLVVGQALIHDLMVQAPVFFGQGGQPATVHGTWIRDYQESLPALPQRAFRHPARFRVDWLLLLQVTMPGERQSCCYPLFLVFDYECLPQHHLRHQLQTFLHARQVAAHRHPLALEHFPVLLILLPGWHRARHWQRWEAELTADGQSQDVRGCLAVVDDPFHSHTSVPNPWRLPWQALYRDGPAPLRDLLRPYPTSAMPHTWRLPSYHGLPMSRKTDKEKHRATAHPSHTTSSRSRAIRFGQFTRRARRIKAKRLSSTTLALMGLVLERHHYRLMELLLVHPLLTSANIAAFLGVQELSVKQYLSTMRSLHCLETETWATDPTTSRWRLSSHGLRLLALRHHLPLSTIATRHEDPEQASPVYIQKGLDQLRRNAARTIGISTFFTQLALGAAQRPQHHLLWWETGDAREQAYDRHARSAWAWGKPHGMGEYQAGAQRVCFWLEWHGHWSSMPHLRQTLTGYASYIRSAEWRRAGSVLPALLVVCPDGERERQTQQIVRDTLSMPRPLPLILTADAETINARGPLASIWNLISFTSQDISTRRRAWYDVRAEEDMHSPFDRGR